MKDRINERPSGAERLLTYGETANLWKCCVRTIARKVERGEIEVVRLSDNMVRIRESVAAKHVADRIKRPVQSP